MILSSVFGLQPSLAWIKMMPSWKFTSFQVRFFSSPFRMPVSNIVEKTTRWSGLQAVKNLVSSSEVMNFGIVFLGNLNLSTAGAGLENK
ncbi:MAG: hypothetical protein L0387_38510 [Acidobacteria bacterium]|nr:hypothetical protein [Acidobacteriota bacterium]MCI0724387.1 hypothetical protein [Acidobacteriota bacterium]